MKSRAGIRLLSLMTAMVMVGTACSGSVVGGGGEEETLKIGVPLALTGPIAAQAEEMVNGYNLYLKQNDGELGGVPTDLLFEDTEADPNAVIAKTRKLIQQDEVHMIGGGALALESLAIIDVVDRANMAFVTPISSADDLTQRQLRPIFARPNMTSSQPNLVLGEWAYNEMDLRRVAVIAQDYAYGWESAGGFQFAFEESGGDVTQKVWVPLDATDMAPFVRQLKTDQVDAVFAMLIGAFVPRFVKTYTDLGLQDETPLIGGPDMIDEDALRAMGDEEVGLIGVHEYAASLPEAQEFVKAYREEYDAVPSYWAEGPYIVAHWLDETITQVIEEEGVSAGEMPGWIRDNPEDFIDIFASVQIESPHGPLSIDDYHNVVTDMHIFEVTAPDTKEVLATVPNASQFWKLSPEEFLENPVFSREFPPVD
jgi:branched-chain amino acid transport system substrate-binding protein